MLPGSKEFIMTPFRNRLTRTKAGPSRPTRLALEELEQRQVPTVTYHGGALLRNVEIQPVYLGSDWSSAANY
jgi:hypothetical protein